jgi:archaellum component FlaC
MRMDTELLAAIKEELSPIRQDIARMQQDISRIDQNMTRMDQDITRLKIQIENDIPRQFNLLAEGQSLILKRLPKPGKAEDLEDRVDVLETVVTAHSADIAELKRAL